MQDNQERNHAEPTDKLYSSSLKRPVTIRLGEEIIDYFKKMSDETGVPYQSLINLYLRDCTTQNKRIDISWNTLTQH